MRKSEAEQYASEQRARINRLGLTEDVLDAADQRAQAVANQNLPARPHVAHHDDKPPLLQSKKIRELALIDGYVDAAMGRPVMVAVRFCEANLHYSNAVHLRVYTEAYTEAHRRKTEQSK